MFSKIISAGALLSATMLFSPPVLAQENVLPSINTPPEVSKANLAKVKAEKHGQYAVPDGFKSGMVETDGIRLHYVSGGEGKGDPIIFVHGFGSTWKMWEPALKKFSANHQVIALDLPGLGLSELSAAGYDAEKMSTYLLGAIKSLTNNQPFTYVCHDLCNSASYPMVANNQDIIKKVVFMDSPIPDKAMWTYPGLTPNGPGLGWHFGYFSFGDIAEKMVSTDPVLFMSYFIKEYAGKKDVFTPELLDELIEPYSTRANLHAAFGYYQSHSDSIRQNEALLAAGKQLTIPVYSISGAKGVNDVLPKQLEARFVKDTSKLGSTILPDTGHWLLEESAPEVNALLENFIDK